MRDASQTMNAAIAPGYGVRRQSAFPLKAVPADLLVVVVQFADSTQLKNGEQI
jgi:hypothetical protein